MNLKFSNLCTPAKLYLVISIISIVFALFNRFNIVAVSIKLLFVLVWTLVLSCLCDKGFTLLSWGLVLFPYILILLAFAGIYRFKEGLQNNTDEEDSTKLITTNKHSVKDKDKRPNTV